MVEKATNNPALLQHHVKTRPSAQAVICHSYYNDQSLHSLSGSAAYVDDKEYFRGVRILSREETSEDERDDHEYDSGADYKNDCDSWDTNSFEQRFNSYSGLFSHQLAQGYTDPVDSDSWIKRWDARSDDEYVAESDSLRSQTSDENSPAKLVHYYGSENELSISSTSEDSDDVPHLWMMRAYRQSRTCLRTLLSLMRMCATLTITMTTRMPGLTAWIKMVPIII